MKLREVSEAQVSVDEEHGKFFKRGRCTAGPDTLFLALPRCCVYRVAS